MSYHLYIGNRAYFSWSLAAGLMFDRFGLGASVDITVLRPQSEDGVRALMADLSPARTLPTVVTHDGAILNDTMAIAEELASRHPEIDFWPQDPLARGTARALANEMHSSFGALRSHWPVNLMHAYAPIAAPDDAAAELDRLEHIWTHARQVTNTQTPWLCGDYSIVDAIFAPMAARLACYGFNTRPTTRAYVAAHLNDPAFKRWRALALGEQTLASCELDYPHAHWPHAYWPVGD